MVEPHSSNFRVIITIFLGGRILRKFTVLYDQNTLFKYQDNYRISTFTVLYDQNTLFKYQDNYRISTFSMLLLNSRIVNYWDVM